MEAAIECLAASGYSATSTSDIAQQAGMTRAAMLYHFPSRMALMEAAIHYLPASAWKCMAKPWGKSLTTIAISTGQSIRLGNSCKARNSRRSRSSPRRQEQMRSSPRLLVLHWPNTIVRDGHGRSGCFHRGNLPSLGLICAETSCGFSRRALAELGELSFDTERRKLQVLEFLKVLCTEPESGTLMQKAIDRARARKKRRPNRQDYRLESQ